MTATESGGRASELRGRYFALLRRAAAVGWQAAKAEYLPDQLDLGRAREEALAELAMFERLNATAVSSGIDPILAQRRRDAYNDTVRPLAIAAGCSVTALAAAMGRELLPALIVASAVTLGSLVLGRAAILKLLR